jgi:acid phosphatase (class A)
LILTELDPDHTDAILARGREFGQSRIVCNVHWKSDVDAGRVIAGAAVARLHADSSFQEDMQGARAEIAEARRNSLGPRSDCAVEAASLGTK